ERLAKVKSAAFDKTGTLTQGTPHVARIEPVAGTREETLQLAASAEQYSVHVFADPIVDHARQQDVELIGVTDAQEIATNGVAATTTSGDQVRVGKSAFIAEVVPVLKELELRAGESSVYVSRNTQLIGVIVLA